MFVFFPVRPIGTSSKFPSYVRGPYKITGVLSDVLYKVNCGRNGLDQPIHCNRIRARKSQLLRGEIMTENIGPHSEENLGAGQTGQKNTDNVETPPTPDSKAEIDTIESEVDEPDTGLRRKRRKPVGAKDYVFCSKTADYDGGKDDKQGESRDAAKEKKVIMKERLKSQQKIMSM